MCLRSLQLIWRLINQLGPYFANSIPGSNYYVEDEFNSYINLKFDCICLSEVWSTNLKSYQSIFQDYIPFFVEPIDNNVGVVAMFFEK